MTAAGAQAAGLQLGLTDAIRETLLEAAGHPSVDKATREEARSSMEGTKVSMRLLKAVCEELRPLRQRAGMDGPYMHKIAAGSGLALDKPPVREKPPELVARLKRLQEAEDQRKYDSMVEDVTKAEREAVAIAEGGGMRTYKEQLGFGLHVIAMMGTCFAIGHVGARGLRDDPVIRMLAGVLGAAMGLLIETLLLIIRSSRLPEGGAEKKES
mmetsp:Transcript_8917/g.29488  ORF Transcript_8917/g.29488 Transcript_8917/m.29488 type:complete len:212 (+) Transcript_8917:58-693(+)